MSVFRIHVPEDIIATATQADSSHCMIADALATAMPEAQRIVVDLQSIRWSDPRKGKRYVCWTPREAQLAIIKFDQGDGDIKPFDLRLVPIQTMPIRSGQKSARSPKTVKGAEVGKLEIHGGKALPLANVPGTAHQGERKGNDVTARRRKFGVRALRP